MSLLPILTAPDPRLKKKSKPVERVDDDVRKLMDDMLQTMYAAPGVGLAAPQVGVLQRVIVVDVANREAEDEGREDAGEPQYEPIKMANPEILWASDEDSTYEEGCLSVPEHYADVVRPAAVRVRYLDYENEIREIEADGLLATCIQHEIDHLDGVLFVDHLTAVKRGMILRKLAKEKKEAAREAKKPAAKVPEKAAL